MNSRQAQDRSPTPRTARALTLRGASGEQFGELGDELLRGVERWIPQGAANDGTTIVEGRVWRVGDWAVKRTPTEAAVRAGLRVSKARRAARRHFDIADQLASPAPRVALDLDGGGGLLVSDWIEAPTLGEIFGDSPAAERGLVELLGAMQRSRHWHGDLHPGNLLWHEGRWWLLDLEDVHADWGGLRARRWSLQTWSRLALNLWLDPLLEPLVREWAQNCGLRLDPKNTWADIRARARRLAERRGLPWPPPAAGWSVGRGSGLNWQAPGAKEKP